MVGFVFGVVVVKLVDYQDFEDEVEFECLVVRVEELVCENLVLELEESEFLEFDLYDLDDFDTLVCEVFDDLLDLLIKVFDKVLVVIFNKGCAVGAYGFY